MEENEKLIIKITNYLLHDVPSFIYDDIKQELLSLGFSILKNKNNITKLDDYLFVSLRNFKIKKINEFNEKKMISLNSKNENDDELLDFVYDSSYENINDDKKYFILNILYYADFCLKETEKKLLIEYFYNYKTQKQIATEYNTSPQNIQKKLKRIIEKLRNYYKSNF